MVKNMDKLGYLSGLIIPFWLAGGVLIAGSLYPGYSHIDQAMSELGALGAPTQSISPIINNYPLGILFCIFSVSLFKRFPSSRLAKTSALLIFLHGICSITAGYFSCDIGCDIESDLNSQALHNLSGLIMFLSLILASGIWVYLGPKLTQHKYLGWFSLLCTLAALAVLPAMNTALESGSGFGLYQRINYGASVIWVAGLAFVLLKTPRAINAHQEIKNL